jgi:lipoate---protein ligase
LGAVPGGRVLSSVDDARRWFDVEPYRASGRRRVVVREVDRKVLVLGSTQPRSLADPVRSQRAGVTVLRRRSGGGAVYLAPAAEVWVDVWLPRGDPLWSDEPRRSAEQVGEWWAQALAASGATGISVHRGASVPAPGSDVACFAGVGPGEVVADGRKVVGLAQWRSRQGALVHGCAYRRWEPGPLVDVLAMEEGRRAALDESLQTVATGLRDIGVPSFRADALVAAFPSPPAWDVVLV